MFDIGWTELLLIGIVALIVVGPKDLPGLFRSLGQFTGKARSMAREFQRAMESAADETGVKDVAKDLKTMTSAKNLGLDAVKDAAKKFDNWDKVKQASKTGSATAAKGPATTALAEERAAQKAALADKHKPAEAAKPAATQADAPAEKPAAKPKAAAKTAAKPAAKTAAKPATKTAAKPAAKPAAKATAKPAAKTAAKPAAKPRAKPAKKSDA